MSAEHVRVIQAVLAALPPHLDEHRPSLEADLTEHSRTLDPDAVAKLGKAALALLDPDGPRPREPRPTRNRLTLRASGEGFDARGWFDRESAATLRTALSPLSAPAAPAPCDGSCGIGGDGASQPDLPERFGGPGRAEDSGCPGHPEREDDAVRDPRSGAERLGDALVELARRGLVRGDPGTEAGEPARLTVTVPLEVLEARFRGRSARIRGRDAGRGDRRGDRPEARLRCAGGADRARDPGRAARCRSGGAAGHPGAAPGAGPAGRRVRVPGLRLPAPVVRRASPGALIDGGETVLENLVLVCGRHHTVIHTQEWTVTMEGGFPLFHPPPWVPGGPRRNPVHRPDLVGAVPAPRRPTRVVNLEFIPG